MSLNSIIFHSLEQVLKVFTDPKVIKLPEVKELLHIGRSLDLIGANYKSNIPEAMKNWKSRNNQSFVTVIEGLDGCGKSSIVNLLSNSLKMKKIKTPPPIVQDLRKFFENSEEPMKRAYFSYGNYLAAQEIYKDNSDLPVILDRFWHSTASSALASFSQRNPELNSLKNKNLDLTWPKDLLIPNLVVFMNVSEEERLRRIQGRSNFTNTEEEKIIASDSNYRENLKTLFKMISGPNFEVVDVNNIERSKNEAAMLNCVSNSLFNFNSKKLKKNEAFS